MITLQAYSDLLGLLHAAPLDDEHWRQFLVHICEFTESLYGIFSSNDTALERRILVHSGMPAFAEAHNTYNLSFRHRDPFRERFMRAPRVGIVEGNDLCPHQELVKTDMYREFLEPMDLHHTTYMVLSMSPRKYEFISMWRSDRPQLTPEAKQLLTLVMPHIQTALHVRQVLGTAERRATNAESVLDVSSTASILLDEHGAIVYMNRAATALAEEGDGICVFGDNIGPTDPAARMAFRTQVLAAAAAFGHDPGGAIALERRSGKRALQTLISPFRPAKSKRSTARVLVLISDPELKVNFPDAVLRALYDLSHAETEIANGLLTGFSLDELATIRKVSVATVRSQMKGLFGKTNTQRQSDLVRLLSSLPRKLPIPFSSRSAAR